MKCVFLRHTIIQRNTATILQTLTSLWHIFFLRIHAQEFWTEKLVVNLLNEENMKRNVFMLTAIRNWTNLSINDWFHLERVFFRTVSKEVQDDFYGIKSGHRTTDLSLAKQCNGRSFWCRIYLFCYYRSWFIAWHPFLLDTYVGAQT